LGILAIGGKMMNAKVLDKIRWLYRLPDYIPDDKIRKHCKGTWSHRRAEVAVAIDDLLEAIKDALPKCLQRWF